MPRKRKGFRARPPSNFRHIRAAYRSGLEATLAAALTAQGIAPDFETLKVPYTQPEKHRNYTPDFFLPNGIVIESKGMFTVEDRQKHLWIKDQHPKLDIRFVFSIARGKIRKGSKTTYADWADKNGFQWAHKEIPKESLTEPTRKTRKDAAEALRKV